MEGRWQSKFVKIMSQLQELSRSHGLTDSNDAAGAVEADNNEGGDGPPVLQGVQPRSVFSFTDYFTN